MSEVVLDREYRCAPEGHTVMVFRKGETVTGRAAELAVADGAAKRPRAPKHTKPAAPTEVK